MVMKENTAKRRVRITNPDGLHLRTCEEVARVASEFQGEATVSRGEKRANAESVLDLELIPIAPARQPRVGDLVTIRVLHQGKPMGGREVQVTAATAEAAWR
jgi:phosphotransferase system HPr (HPr) family protein